MTQEYLKEVFDYKDGFLYWKVQMRRGVKGEKAGGINQTSGRRTIGILGKKWMAHRLIFIYHYGFTPEFIDHIDQDVTNNNIENLRAATKSENGSNRGKTKRNTSGFKGVWFKKSSKKWAATIQKNKKSMHLGVFETIELANEAYKKAALIHHKQFANV